MRWLRISAQSFLEASKQGLGVGFVCFVTSAQPGARGDLVLQQAVHHRTVSKRTVFHHHTHEAFGRLPTCSFQTLGLWPFEWKIARNMANSKAGTALKPPAKPLQHTT
jgi:hypothetical protein